jgi:type II secretory pathway pseudopilin PulG
MNVVIAILIVAGAAFVLGWKACEWTVQRQLRALEEQLRTKAEALDRAVKNNQSDDRRQVRPSRGPETKA